MSDTGQDKMVSQNVDAADEWTEWLNMEEGHHAVISVIGTNLIGKTTLQRRFGNNDNPQKVKAYTANNFEDDYRAGFDQQIRIGIATDEFTSGSATMIVRKSKARWA